VSAADAAAPISAAHAKALFAPLAHVPSLILAVSGGPDSTALLVLAARWRAASRRGPELLAVTVDHGLRRESAAEARAVARLAQILGVRHRTLRWRGKKPVTGLQQAARNVRYRLIAQAARTADARHVLTAHTLDDQAETVLIRMMRGSGLTGLGAMAPVAALPAMEGDGLFLVRPFLDIPKARLIATLVRANIPFAEDPSNRDPRFMRPRLRGVMPALAGEGLDASRLALLARRLRRAEAAIEMAVDAATAALWEVRWSRQEPVTFDAQKFAELPAELALRLLGRAIAHTGDEGPVELGKLEVLLDDLRGVLRRRKPVELRRTLAGAMVTLSQGRIRVERAPPRRRLTTARHRRRKPSKRR
jgi:tRNA(Ile)-lysidine synthase